MQFALCEKSCILEVLTQAVEIHLTELFSIGINENSKKKRNILTWKRLSKKKYIFWLINVISPFLEIKNKIWKKDTIQFLRFNEILIKYVSLYFIWKEKKGYKNAIWTNEAKKCF